MKTKARLISLATLLSLFLIFPIVSPLPSKAQSGNQGNKLNELETYTETVSGATIEMVRVPGGTFLMGSPDGEGNADEHPQHQVTVSSFYMGKYEVTQTQWRAVARLPKVKIDLDADPSKFKGDNLPIEQLRWEEAMEFCDRLSKETGKTYRLPTEAEWEYACRASTTGKFAGDLDEMAWYYNKSDRGTHPVGTKRPNGFGLYDMHGNAWEWCMDWYSEKYYKRSPSVDPKGPSKGLSHVGRGGCWGLPARYCRSAFRFTATPGAYNVLGFRLVAGR